MLNLFSTNDVEMYSQFHREVNGESYKFMGAHSAFRNLRNGVVFRVYAPNAEDVFVSGDFCNWDDEKHCMYPITENGLYECFIPGVTYGNKYRYVIITKDDKKLYRPDPYAFQSIMVNNETISVISNPFGYHWKDGTWRRERINKGVKTQPVNIYELHLGSWRRNSDNSNCNYRTIADTLVAYVNEMSYTHVLLMPINFPTSRSVYGYIVRSFFAPNNNYGEASDLMYLIDKMHEAGIAVILDIPVMGFPEDDRGLFLFDGDHLYEEPNPLHRLDRKTGMTLFNYASTEIQSFMISAAVFWTSVYHFDGIKLSAVSSVLHLDYERGEGEWEKNTFGGNENLAGISFLQNLNKELHQRDEHIITIAKDDSGWPTVTQDSLRGGLGFDFTMDSHWTENILSYMSNDPFFRKNYHQQLTENLNLSAGESTIVGFTHNQVMFGQCSMINKMPGDYENKFSNLRTLYGYMMSHPGKKILFMGSEIGQFIEWKPDKSLSWMLLDFDSHLQLQRYIKALNRFYLKNPSLWELDNSIDGFAWLVSDDSEQNIIVFSRYDGKGSQLICISNFAPVMRENYCIGVPSSGVYREVFNSNEEIFGGCGQKNSGDILSRPGLRHGHNNCISIMVPPLSTIFINKES